MSNKWINSECVFTKISYLQRKSKLSHKELLLLVDYCNEAERLDKDRFDAQKKLEHDRHCWVESVLLATAKCEGLIHKRNNNLIASLTRIVQQQIEADPKTLLELENITKVF